MRYSKYILFITIFIFSSFGITKKYSFEQSFSNLTQDQRARYIKEFRTILNTMSVLYPELQVIQKKHVLYQFFLNTAYAAIKELPVRCMYGGFIIRGHKCKPKTTFKLGNKTLSCKGQIGSVLCNPLLYGDNSGKGLCVRNSINATRSCEKASDRNMNNILKISDNNVVLLAELVSDFFDLCLDPQDIAALRGRKKALEEVKKTCAIAKRRLDLIIYPDDKPFAPKYSDNFKSKPRCNSDESHLMSFPVSCKITKGKLFKSSDQICARQCKPIRTVLDKNSCLTLHWFSSSLATDLAPKSYVTNNDITFSGQCHFQSINCEALKCVGSVKVMGSDICLLQNRNQKQPHTNKGAK